MSLKKIDILLIISFFAVITTVFFCTPDKIDADGKAADKLTVTIGYYGGETETKKEYTASALSSLGLKKVRYTWIDSMPALCYQDARGVDLLDVIKDAEIDKNSISRIYFYTNDKGADYRGNFTYNELFKTRYYYPKLGENLQVSPWKPLYGAEDGKEERSVMIAIEDEWHRVESYDPFELPSFSGTNSTYRFRLCFGMTDTSTRTAYDSSKWIYRIHVELGGSPPDEKNGDSDDDKLAGSLKDEESSEKKEKSESDSNESKDKMIGIKKKDGKSQNAGKQAWRINNISADAAPMQAPEEDLTMLPYAIGAGVFSFILGGILEYLFVFRREVLWRKRGGK